MNTFSKHFEQCTARGEYQSTSEITSSPGQQETLRRVSNMSDLADPPTRRGTLSDGIDLDDMSLSSLQSPKEVSFAAYSDLHVYEVDRTEKFKSYNASERKAFHAQACREAARICALIENSPYDGASAIRQLLDSGVLVTEELVGIENLISRKSGMKSMKERRVHVAMVLKKQRDLKEKEDVFAGRKLAAASITRSLKSVEKARSRAALAA